MPRFLGMCDRVLVMHEGKMTGILDRTEANRNHYAVSDNSNNWRKSSMNDKPQ